MFAAFLFTPVMSDPRLLAVATAVPPYLLRQPDVQRRLSSIFRERSVEAERYLPVFDNAGIDSRYSCVPLEWYEQDHGWSDRNPVYLESAVTLLREAAERALQAADLAASEIDGIVARLNIRNRDAEPGCSSDGADGVSAATCSVCRSSVSAAPAACSGWRARRGWRRRLPNERILFLVVEPCALTFCRSDYSKSNIVATALFGDGASAAVISCTGVGPRIAASGEYTWPGTLSVMGWEVEDDGLRVVFSRDIPSLVRERFRPALDGFLVNQKLAITDIDQWLCHPGGAKVLDALEDVLDVDARYP